MADCLASPASSCQPLPPVDSRCAPCSPGAAPQASAPACMPSSSALPVSGRICLLPVPACLPSQYCSSKTLWLPCMPAEVASITLAGALAAAAAFCSCTQVRHEHGLCLTMHSGDGSHGCSTPRGFEQDASQFTAAFMISGSLRKEVIPIPGSHSESSAKAYWWGHPGSVLKPSGCPGYLQSSAGSRWCTLCVAPVDL